MTQNQVDLFHQKAVLISTLPPFLWKVLKVKHISAPRKKTICKVVGILIGNWKWKETGMIIDILRLTLALLVEQNQRQIIRFCNSDHHRGYFL